jgi:hypothetical protein
VNPFYVFTLLLATINLPILAIMGRYIFVRKHFIYTQFPDDWDREGPQNVSLLAVQPCDVTDRLRIFYGIIFIVLNL